MTSDLRLTITCLKSVMLSVYIINVLKLQYNVQWVPQTNSLVSCQVLHHLFIILFLSSHGTLGSSCWCFKGFQKTDTGPKLSVAALLGNSLIKTCLYCTCGSQMHFKARGFLWLLLITSLKTQNKAFKNSQHRLSALFDLVILSFICNLYYN